MRWRKERGGNLRPQASTYMNPQSNEKHGQTCIALTLVEGSTWWLQKAAETRQIDNNFSTARPNLGGWLSSRT